MGFVHSTVDHAVHVYMQALAGDIVLCSWANGSTSFPGSSPSSLQDWKERTLGTRLQMDTSEFNAHLGLISPLRATLIIVIFITYGSFHRKLNLDSDNYKT